MGAISSSTSHSAAKNLPSVENSNKGTVYSDDSLEMVSFLFGNSHVTVVHDRDLKSYLAFRGGISEKESLMKKLIGAAPTEVTLNQHLNQLQRLRQSTEWNKLSSQQQKQLDADIEETKNALANIQVDTVLKKISHAPQNRESFVKEFDSNVARALELSHVLTQKIVQFLNAGLIQQQQKVPTERFASIDLLQETPQQRPIPTTGGKNPIEKGKDVSARTNADRLQDELNQSQAATKAEQRQKLEGLQTQYAQDRKKQTSGN